MFDSMIGESFWVVLWLVKLDHYLYILLFEDWNVIRRAKMKLIIPIVTRILWSAKRQKFAGNDPIHVSIFHFFVVFVVLDIKIVQGEPVSFDGEL